MQQVPGEAVVEGVASDVGGRFQPGGQGEGVGFAGERRGQQPSLDLGSKAGSMRCCSGMTLAPLLCRLISEEIVSWAHVAGLEPYRPARLLRRAEHLAGPSRDID